MTAIKVERKISLKGLLWYFAGYIIFVKYTAKVINNIDAPVKCRKLKDFNENNKPIIKDIKNKYIISSNGFFDILT